MPNPTVREEHISYHPQAALLPLGSAPIQDLILDGKETAEVCHWGL